MALSVEDIEDQSKYREFVTVPYDGLIHFIFKYLMKPSVLSYIGLAVSFLFLALALSVRISIAGCFAGTAILFHSVLGLILLPILSIPLHESLHIIPCFIFGARDIRAGIDLKQCIIYVTAHRHVATSREFIVVAVTPFLLISAALLSLVFSLPGLWKWSLSLFLLVHTTMCAGDIALLNFYWVNRGKKIYTWDDADRKMAYFFEGI